MRVRRERGGEGGGGGRAKKELLEVPVDTPGEGGEIELKKNLVHGM